MHNELDEERFDSPRTSAITIRQVAEEAGVSIATVSRAFSRPSKVNVHTLNRVHEAAARLGYRTDAVATVHESELRGLIGLVVTDLENPISAQYARAVQRYCSEKNCGLLIMDTQENAMTESAIIKRSLSHVDGVILDSTRLSDAAIRKLAQVKPVVVLNRVVRGVSSVTFDCTPGLVEAVDTFATLGHRRISYLSGPDNSWQNGVRRHTLLRACRERGLQARIMPCAYPLEAHMLGCFEAFMRHPTSAVIAFNDAIALRFIRYLKDLGVDVPGQISVMGIDDIPMAAAVTPSLSTLSFPRARMGDTAARIIIDPMLHIGRGAGNLSSFSARFVRRDSIAEISPLIAAGIA